jgi:peptidoglycan/xylan/chitin deacetylase (PgdA/CDA1 family)
MVKSPAALAQTLTRQADRIEQLAGSRPCRLFRPHAGWRGSAMLQGLKQIDHRLVGWSFGMWDFNWFRRPNPATLANRLARRAGAGDIIVMHDGHHVNPRADRRHTSRRPACCAAIHAQVQRRTPLRPAANRPEHLGLPVFRIGCSAGR